MKFCEIPRRVQLLIHPIYALHILLDILEEEGLKLANRREDPTYIAPNGTSTIDLVFYRGKRLMMQQQVGLWTSTAAPIRKRIPIIRVHRRNITKKNKKERGKQDFKKTESRTAKTREKRDRGGKKSSAGREIK